MVDSRSLFVSLKNPASPIKVEKVFRQFPKFIFVKFTWTAVCAWALVGAELRPRCSFEEGLADEFLRDKLMADMRKP
jgi:hypothetical protein